MESEARATSWLDRGMSAAELVLYGMAALVLLTGGAILLVDAGVQLIRDAGDNVEDAVTGTLDRLLLAFILVELLSAVRVTVRERKLVAEPFLIVGMIAAIKEIILEGVHARELVGTKGDSFTDAMVTISVLAGVLVALGVTTLLVRRKEREPTE